MEHIEVEKTLKSEKIYQGKILSLRIDTIEMPNKKYSKREIVEHKPAVVIIAIKGTKLLMVRQFRKAVEKTLLEVPAGLVEIQETPVQAASRELEEETGYLCENPKYIMEFYTSPGYSDEKIDLFLAEDLVKTEQNLDDGEFLEVEEIEIDELRKKVLYVEVQNASSIIAINYAYDYIKSKNEHN